MVKIIEVKTKTELRQFIDLPFFLHKNHKSWLPTIYADDQLFFDKNRNKSFEGNEVKLFLAEQDHIPIGRIMGIIPKKYNLKHGLHDVRFGYIDCIEDFEVFNALIQAVIDWASVLGCKSVVGPMGFSDKEPQGFEIEGIENPPLILTYVNFPYLVKFIEKAGFVKKTDLISYSINIPETYPDEVFQKLESFKPLLQDLKILNFRSLFGIKKYMIPAFELINELFVEIYAHTPLSINDMKQMTKRFLPLLSPRFVKGVLNSENELVAIIFGMADFARGLQNCGGKLFPFGFLKILFSQIQSDEVLLIMGAIKKEYKNIGIDYWMSWEYFNELKKRNIKRVKSHLILEGNPKTQAKMTKFGGEIYKRFRIFHKNI